jgi:hypothetical protein
MSEPLRIAISYFPDAALPKPKKGENRLQYFQRTFAKYFEKPELKEIERFIEKFGYQPLLPDWIATRGCYPITAIEVFRYYNSKNSNRNRMISAIWFADLVSQYPQLRKELDKMAKLVWRVSSTQPKELKLKLKEILAQLDKGAMRKAYENKIRNSKRSGKQRNRTQQQTSKTKPVRKSRKVLRETRPTKQ